MKELLTSDDLSELDSVQVTEPQETQTYHKCNEPPGHLLSSQNGSFMAFFKRNAFVVFSVTAVALGE